MGKIVASAYNVNTYNMLSQTPKNLNQDNYYLQTLQDKVDADWEYRPNRVEVEEEQVRGSEEYTPLEVVIQSVKNDKGEKVSDDYRRLVFRDIRYTSKIGTKYRFNYNFDLEEPDDEKWIWLVTNRDTITPTSQVVITRCNGNIASTYKDENGFNQIHYEPIISGTNLSGTAFHFDDTIVTAKADLTIIVQYNAYTMNYYINQRFIIGPNQVYKITAIQNTNSLSTFKVNDVGLMILYADLDQKSEQDNFETRLAYNTEEEAINPSQPERQGDAVCMIGTPNPLPKELYSQPITFTGGLYYAGTLDTSVPITVECDLNVSSNPMNYFELAIVDNNTFSLRRKRVVNKTLNVKISVAGQYTPSGEEMSQSFDLFLGELE